MKKLLFLAAAAVVLSVSVAGSAVVRPAPNITWVDYTGKLKGLGAFKGQPIVVIVAPSPLDRSFRAQVGQLHKMYERYAAAKVVFVAAFTQEPGRIKSNIPFAIAGGCPRIALSTSSIIPSCPRNRCDARDLPLLIPGKGSGGMGWAHGLFPDLPLLAEYAIILR